MTVSSLPVEKSSVRPRSRWQDYVALTKPRISFMVLLTVVAAGYLASTVVDVTLIAVTNAVIGTLLIAASGSALNQCVERWLDARMSRTQDRPLPSQRLGLNEVVVFGTITFCMGLMYLGLTIGWGTAGIGLATWLLYVWVYTPLKTRTWANTIVGAVAGAMPVLIGWYATGAPTHVWIISLFSLLLLWQFPHFMAIAWLYREQYAAGGMKMLPVVDPTGYWSAVEAVVTALLLVPITLLPMSQLSWPLAVGFAACSLLLNGFYVQASIGFLKARDEIVARKLLRVSLLYLPLMMLLMVLAAWWQA